MSYTRNSQGKLRKTSEADLCLVQGVCTLTDVRDICTSRPSLRKNPEAWKLLIDNSMETEALQFADETTIRSDKLLMSQAIKKCGPESWRHLSPNLKADAEMALLALRKVAKSVEWDDLLSFIERFYSYIDLIQTILDFSPDLRDNPDFWRLLIDIFPLQYRDDMIDSYNYIQPLWETAPSFILDNDEIVRLACMDCSPNILGLASERIRRDLGLVNDIIEGYRHKWSDFLIYVPEDVLLNNPNTVLRYIENGGDLAVLMDALPEPLWKNRDIVKAYFREGGKPHRLLEESANKDWELCLALVAGFQGHDSGSPLKSWISDELRHNREFLFEANKVNPYTLFHALKELKQDSVDLLLIATCYHGCQALDIFQKYQRIEADFDTSYEWIDLLKFAQDVRGSLQEFEDFKTFLCGVKIERDDECLLPILNLGPNCLIIERIASFAGIPNRERIKLLRKVSPEVRRICTDDYCNPFFMNRAEVG